MLAFISNLAPSEVIVVLIAAVLIFGRRLPEVAAKSAVQLQKLRRGVNDFKRESGFDEELRKARRLIDNPIREVSKELSEEPASWRPKSPTVEPHPDTIKAQAEAFDIDSISTPAEATKDKEGPAEEQPPAPDDSPS